MLHRIGRITALLSVLAAGGCSAIIDVDPNCSEVSECGAYACDAENVACLTACRSDGDCATGHSCNFATTTCEAQTCTPATSVVEIPELAVQNGVTEVHGASGLGQVVLVASNPSSSMVFSRRNLDGSLLIGGDDPEPFVPIESEANASRLANLPEVAFLPSADGVADRDAFHVVYRRRTGSGNLNELWLYQYNPSTSETSRNLMYRAGASPDVSQFGVASTLDGLMAAWVSTRNAEDRYYALRTDRRGLDPTPDPGAEPGRQGTEDRIQVSESATSVRFGALARAEGKLWAIHTVQSDQGRGLVARPLAYDGSMGDSFRVVETDSPIETMDAAGNAFSSIAVYGVPTGQGVGLRRVTIGNTGSTTVSPIGIDDGFSKKERAPELRLDVAAGLDDFAVLFHGQREGRNDIWMRRVVARAEADVAFAPIPVTGVETATPRSMHVFPILDRDGNNQLRSDGYGVVWVSDDAAARKVFYRRFTCAR